MKPNRTVSTLLPILLLAGLFFHFRPTGTMVTPSSAVLENAAPRPESTPPAGRISPPDEEDFASFSDFDSWLETYATSPPASRPAITEEGVRLATLRRSEMEHLIRHDPEKAIALTVTPAQRAQLPPPVLAQLEEIVMGKGFFGVLCTCGSSRAENPHVAGDHASGLSYEVMLDGRPYAASVYGHRLRKPTTDGDSIFGVAIGGHLALHEDEIVTISRDFFESDSSEKNVGAIFQGETNWFNSTGKRDEWIAALTEEQAEISSGTTAAGLTFDPAVPPSGATPPTEVYDRYSGRNSHQLGPKTVMVMIVRPSDGDTYGSSPPTRTSLLPGLRSASQWYYNESYKQTWFGPKEDSLGVLDELVVTTEIDLPNDVAFYKDSFGSLRADAKAAVEAQGGDWTNNGPRTPTASTAGSSFQKPSSSHPPDSLMSAENFPG